MTAKPPILPPVDAEPGRPLYTVVQKAVRQAIDSGIFNPGDQLPSTKELSKQLDVSLVTVHRALQELVASGVLRRGQGRGTYVHEEYGRRADTSTGLRFGLVFHRESSLGDFFHSQVLEGVRQAADELGVDLVLLRFGEDWRNECQGYVYVNPFEGQLDRPPRFGSRPKERNGKLEGSHPLMVVGASFDRPGVSWIDTDNRALSRQAVQHLHGLGHRRIGYVGGQELVPNDRDRWSGFKAAMEGLNTPIDPTCVVGAAGWRLEESGRDALVRLLKSEKRPTAIFAAGYYFALDVYEAAGRAGLNIPGDLSVVSVDDPASAAHLSPGLTTMRQPLIQLGKQGGRGLFEQIGEEHPTVQRTLLEAELVIRKSTAAPSTGTGAAAGAGGTIGVKAVASTRDGRAQATARGTGGAP